MINEQEQQKAEPIKLIVKTSCPKCKEKLYIAYNVPVPGVDAILTEGDVKTAKEKVLKRIEEIKFKDDKQKEMALQWINNPITIFGEANIESVIQSIITSQQQNEDTK